VAGNLQRARIRRAVVGRVHRYQTGVAGETVRALVPRIEVVRDGTGIGRAALRSDRVVGSAARRRSRAVGLHQGRLPPQVVLFDIRQDEGHPAQPVILVVERPGVGRYTLASTDTQVPQPDREVARGVVVAMQCDTDLVQVVGALDAVGRITHLLHG